MGLLEQEQDTYAGIWSAVPSYADHAPGEQYLPVFLGCVGDRKGTVLDAGCGSGKAALSLAALKFDVRLCDVTDAGLVAEARVLPFYPACLWRDLSHVTRNFGAWGRSRADWVYCTDVLEHIPPQFTMLAIRNLLAVAREGLFLTVSLVPDNFGVWTGKTLHQTVQPFTWWKDSIRELSEIVEARDLIANAVFVVRPR